MLAPLSFLYHVRSAPNTAEFGLCKSVTLFSPGFDRRQNLIAILPRPRSTLSLCMRRLCIAWILTPVKASIDIVSVLSGAFVEYIAACSIGYRRLEGMRCSVGFLVTIERIEDLSSSIDSAILGTFTTLDVLLTRVDSEYCISTVTSFLEALLLDGSLLSSMLTLADTCLPGIVVGYLVFCFHQYTCLTTTHPPQLSRRSRRSSALKLDRLVHQRSWTGLCLAGGPGGPAYLDRLFGTLLSSYA
jgi:hypothetical protein